MKKETLNFRVSMEFKRKLVEKAQKERRSLTNYIEAALTEFWDLQESDTGTRPEKRKRPETSRMRR